MRIFITNSRCKLNYSMYKFKLKSRIPKKRVILPFKDNHSDDWITEVVNKENAELIESTIVELVGNYSNPTLDTF